MKGLTSHVVDDAVDVDVDAGGLAAGGHVQELGPAARPGDGSMVSTLG